MISQLIGLWLYTGLIFHGEPAVKPSPELVIYFQFTNQIENTLFYFRQGERGFCERKAAYSVDAGQISQTITEVNELNSSVCAQDPDMQMGRQAITRFEIKNEQLYLYLTLGEDELIYVWTKIF